MATSTPTLETAVAQLARHRASQRTLLAEMKALRDAWEAAHAKELDALADLCAFIAEDEAIVREMALATGETHPHPAVTVKTINGLEYDQQEAQAWAMEHHLALSFDKRTFEKIAKSTALPFVLPTLTLRADIATDLSPYLETTPT